MKYLNKHSILFLLIIGTGFPCLIAQPQETPPPDEPIYSLDNPQEAVSRHLYYLDREHYNPLHSADALFPGKRTEEERIELAKEIKYVFDSQGDYIQVELIPDDPDYLDTATNQHRYVVLPDKYPEIFLEKYDGKWQYSKSTVANIPQIYDRIYPLGAEFLQNLVPEIGQHRFLGMALWKYIGIALIIGVCVVLYWLFNWISSILFKRFLPKLFPKTTLKAKIILPVAHPLGLLLLALLIRQVLMPMLMLPIQVSAAIAVILKIALPVFGVIFFYRVVEVLTRIFANIAENTETPMDDQLIPLLSKAAKLVVVIFGFLIILQNLDVNITALLAGISIGGLALALAAQETVKNFIGSVSIFVDRPFVVGDFIDTGAFSGVITEVGVRSTRLRALDGAMVSVPNGKIADMTVTNHGVRTYRRYATSLTVTYATPPDVLEAFVDGVRKILLEHPLVRDESAIVHFHELADSSLNIFFAAIYETTDYTGWLAARQEVLLKVMRLAEEMKVEFAFPSTSVYVESMPAITSKS